MFRTANDYLFYSAQKYRDKIAVEDNSTSITYSDLEKKANTAAHFLKEIGIKKGDRIGIFLDNSIYFITNIFAVFKIAGIYVPLNTRAPIELLRGIIHDCGIKLIITSTKRLRKLLDINDGPQSFSIIVVDDSPIEKSNITKNVFFMSHIPGNESYCINENDSPKNLAYIIYTSGSTGKPKGVAIRHESIMNYIEASAEIYGFDLNLNTINLNPFFFDGSLGSIFRTIFVGGYLYIFTPELIIPKVLIRRLIDKRITHLGCTPALFKMLVKYINPQNRGSLSLKSIAVGGDTCPVEYMKKIIDILPNVRLFNGYGPTETTVIVAGYELKKGDLDKKNEIPFGKAINKNVRLHAFNNKGELIKPGEMGELYIGGIQVMAGYWNDKALTDTVLKKDMIKGDILYKTGDFVTIDEDDNYIFKGRMDDMIKKDGFRIYLSEIENALNDMSCIKESACITVNKGEHIKIAAFIVLKGKNSPVNEIQDSLRKKIPEYMIPDRFKFLGDIPHTPIGKVDKSQLKSLL